jgi:hypothetical protein
MRKILAALLCLVAGGANATQKTPAQLTAEINAQITTNGRGAISGAILNGILRDIVDSYADRSCTQFSPLVGAVITADGNCTTFLSNPNIASGNVTYTQPVIGSPTFVKNYLDDLAFDLNLSTGAYPNLATDSSSGFNAAFLAAKGGKTIRVPGGSAYTLSNPVTMQIGSVLQGVRQTPPDDARFVGSRINLGANVDRLITQPTIHTVTITIGSPTIFHLANHGLTTADKIVVETTGALPTGISGQPTHYWVVNPTADTFQISDTQNGAAINSSGTQSGVHTIVTNLLHSPSIVGMMVDGKKANHSALALLDLSPVTLTLHDSSFNDASNDCVRLRTNPYDAAWLNWITNSIFFRCNGAGIRNEASDSYFIANDYSSNTVGFDHFSSSGRFIGNQVEVSTDTGLVVRNLYGAGFPGTGLLTIGNQFAYNTNADIHFKVGNGTSHLAYGPVIGNNFHLSGGVDIDNSVTDGVMVGNVHSFTTSPNDIRFGGVNNTGWQIYGMVSEKTPANRFSNLPPDAQVLSSGPGGAFNRLQSLILSSVPSGVRVADTRLNVFGSDAVLGANNVIARFGVDRDEPNIDAALLVGSANGAAPFFDCVNGELTTVVDCEWRFKHNTAIRLNDSGVQFPVLASFQNGIDTDEITVRGVTGVLKGNGAVGPVTAAQASDLPYTQPGAGAAAGNVGSFLDGLAFDMNAFTGAYPNSATDSSSAFNAAFLAARGDKTIRVPGGNAYTLAAPVTMQAGNVLQGVRQAPTTGSLVSSRINLGANVDRLITQPTIHTVTITIGSPAVFNLVNHGLTTADRVVIETTGALPTGISRQPTAYWVVNPTANTFQISATQNGAAINASGVQSGVHTIVTNLLHSPSIVGMTVNGQKATRSALALVDLSPVNLVMQDTNVTNGSNDCVRLRTNPTSTAWLDWIVNSSISLCNGHGIYTEATDSLYFGNGISNNGIGFEHFSTSNRLIGNQIEVSTDTGLIVGDLISSALSPGTALQVIGNNFNLNTNADIRFKSGTGYSHSVYGPIVGNDFLYSGGIDIENNVLDGVMVGNVHAFTTSPNDIRFGGTNNTGWQIYGMVSEKTPANRFLNLPPDAQVLSGGPGGAFNRLQSLILASPSNATTIADTRLNVFGSDTVLGASNVDARFGITRNSAGLDAALLIGSAAGTAPFFDCVNGELTTVVACTWRFKHNTAIRLNDSGVQFPVLAEMQRNAIVRQGANNDVALTLSRQTNTSPTGYLLRALDAAGTGELFRIGVDGRVGVTGLASGTAAFATFGAYAAGDLGILFGRSGQTSGLATIQGIKNGVGANDLQLQPDGGAVWIGGPVTLSGPLGLAPATWTNAQPCIAGQISVDADYIYVCTATNTVKRVALSTF